MNSLPHPFTLRQLQYLVAVADRRNFRRAAEACHVSQPALSAQIAQCEELLGVRIFERDPRNVTVTEAGHILIARIRHLLLLSDELVSAAQALTDPLAGTLRIGIIPTVAPYLLPDVTPALRTSLPRLVFRWVEDKTPTLSKLLSEGEIDAAILALEAQLGDVAHAVIGSDPFVLATARDHRLGRTKKPARLDELDGEQVLLLDDGHCFRDQAIAACAEARVTEASYRATSLSTLVQMAAQGQAVTLLPELALGVENRRQDLVIRRFAGSPPVRTLALVWRRRSGRDETFKALARSLVESWTALTKSSR
jgi:LysR family hydrogen peroxide-inducible transcriptional activator